MKLLLVALEIGTTGIFFNTDEGSGAQQTQANSLLISHQMNTKNIKKKIVDLRPACIFVA